MKFTSSLFALFTLLVFTTSPLFAQIDRYASFMEKGEKPVSGDYQYVFSKLKDGSFRERRFFPEDMLLTEVINYKDEFKVFRHGVNLRWYDNGHRRFEANYEDGKLQGPYYQYDYETDSMFVRGQYVKGKREGEWLIYHDSGLVKERTLYRNDQREGDWISYDTLGAVITQRMMHEDTVFAYTVGAAPTIDLPENMPQFPGCEEIEDPAERKKCSNRKMLEFVYGNLKYPTRAITKEVSGRSEASFVVEKDGAVSDIRVMNGLNRDIAKEVERIISSMPTWHPAIREGEPVRVKFILPVTFKFE